jgi:hypothetical protein
LGGHSLTSDQCNELAGRLCDELESGRTAAEADALLAAIAAIPIKPCPDCRGTGKPPDDADCDQDAVCSQCDGVGYLVPFPAVFDFDEKIVKEFVVFLRTCGGFLVF